MKSFLFLTAAFLITTIVSAQTQPESKMTVDPKAIRGEAVIDNRSSVSKMRDAASPAKAETTATSATGTSRGDVPVNTNNGVNNDGSSSGTSVNANGSGTNGAKAVPASGAGAPQDPSATTATPRK